jgi:hypothetical protein
MAARVTVATIASGTSAIPSPTLLPRARLRLLSPDIGILSTMSRTASAVEIRNRERLWQSSNHVDFGRFGLIQT